MAWSGASGAASNKPPTNKPWFPYGQGESDSDSDRDGGVLLDAGEDGSYVSPVTTRLKKLTKFERAQAKALNSISPSQRQKLNEAHQQTPAGVYEPKPTASASASASDLAAGISTLSVKGKISTASSLG